MSKTITATVVSTKMHKTVIVEVKRATPHPIYKKKIRRSRRFKVHSEEGNIIVGDTVTIVETKPISKEKHWKIQEVVKK